MSERDSLNTVADDDERELLQELFERRLNAELYAGSQSRGATVLIAPLNESVAQLALAPVVDIFSRKVD